MNQFPPPRGSSDDDIDARFAAIVAGWDDDAPEPSQRVATDRPAPTPPVATPSADGASADRPASAVTDQPAPGPSSLPKTDGTTAPILRSGPAAPPAVASTAPAPAVSETPDAPAPAGEPLPAAPPEPRRPLFDVAPSGWRVHVSPDEDSQEETFEPPDPPLPRGDLRFWGAIVGLVLGPLLFVLWVMTSPHSTNLPLFLGGLGTAAGFAALISQLPQHRDEDDDGARV